jgi:hypothetical protein
MTALQPKEVTVTYSNIKRQLATKGAERLFPISSVKEVLVWSYLCLLASALLLLWC